MTHDNIDQDPFEQIASIDYKQRKEAAQSKKRDRIYSGQIRMEDTHCSAQESSHDNHNGSVEDFNLDNVFVLKREANPTQSKGHFFLAIVFGMMCCSSYMVNNQGESLQS